LQQLTFKSYDLKAFAGFIALHKATKEKVPALQVKVDYIKSLFEVTVYAVFKIIFHKVHIMRSEQIYSNTLSFCHLI
jgi:hypothetical protein